MFLKLERWVDPQRAFDALYAGSRYAFWLDESSGATGVSRMGEAAPGASIALASVADGSVTVLGADGIVSASRAETIYDFLRRETTGAADDWLPAWVGWIGYEAGAAVLGVAVEPTRGLDAAVLRTERVVSFDHAARTVTVSAVDSPNAAEWLRMTAEVLASIGEQPESAPENLQPDLDPDRAELRWRHSDTEYLALIERCHDAIHRGDAYQLCLTNTAVLAAPRDPLASYRALRAASPAPHGGYLRFGDHRLLSASPEQFLTVSSGGIVSTSPIKGTRPRGSDPAADDALRAQLLASDKERAENLMIVDLMRNDLARVSELGTVTVRALLEVRSYAQVHQLVSTVEGRLAAGRGAIDALEACFPAGSMTGTPKSSAMRILHGLEAGARGVYAGCFGTFGADGSLSLSMVIRSIVVDGDTATIGSGGGITALSDPDEELAEVKLKAAVLLAALSEGTPGGRHETNR